MKIINNIEPGSLEHMRRRVGKITMSRAKDLLTGGKGKTRMSYILDVVAERLSGEPIEGYHGIDMERGHFLEDWALQAFTLKTGLDVERVAMILSDDERIGASPDALIGSVAGVEIKCPKPRQHIRNMLQDGLKEYIPQVQGNLWLTNRTIWYLVSYCPWVKHYPLHIQAVDRDEDMIQRLADSAVDAANTVDDFVFKTRAMEPSANTLDQADQARKAWENVLADETEVII